MVRSVINWLIPGIEINEPFCGFVFFPPGIGRYWSVKSEALSNVAELNW